ARIVGLVEVAVGAAAVAWWRPALGALALLSLAFALVTVRALRAGASSCGCFGSATAPPTVAHVAVNLVGAAASAVVLVGSSAAPATAAWPVIALGAALLIAGLTAGGQVIRGVRDVAGHRETFRRHAVANEAA